MKMINKLLLMLYGAYSATAFASGTGKGFEKHLATTGKTVLAKKSQRGNIKRKSIEETAKAVCAIEDNGQDWAKLQIELRAQLSAAKLSKQSKQRQRSTLSSVFENNGEDGRYYIPVVFHVYGEQFNCNDASKQCLTDEKILDALNRTNEDFLGTNSQDGPIDPLFQAIRENLDIEFVLAKKDPQGRDANGIVRYDREQKGYGNGSGFDALIAADAWDNSKYMNVYIMNDLYDDGETTNSGVAWYPQLGMTDNNVARVVYNGAYLGSNTDENFRSVLTHEFGHWLNLPHTFAGKSCSLENETFCALTGDRSCDTPQMSLASDMYNNSLNCLGQKTNTENFMHYTSNYAMFTQEQVKRMTAALHGPSRVALWSNENLLATGLEHLTSNSDRFWDGESGLDKGPVGIEIVSYENLSAAKGDIDSYPIDIPENTEAVGFYLSGYSEDPDMYVSAGRESAKGENGDWDADYISFAAKGEAEFVGVLAPQNQAPYYVTVDAFSDYNNANLQVIAVDDPLLPEGMVRHHVLKLIDIWSPAGKAPKKYQVEIPENAEKTVVVFAGAYGGDPDMYISLDRPAVADKDLSDCAPYSAAKLAEYCEFDRGGSVNILLDPFKEYWEGQLHIYYETRDNANQNPIAITKPQYRAIVEHDVYFKGQNSIDVDGDIVSYLWDFGDGNTSSNVNPIHSYAEIGDYTAKLTVTDDQGIAASTTSQVSITLLSPDDETLCQDCTRIYLTEAIELSATKGEQPRAYQFLVPDAASLVAIEIVGGSNGDPDLHVSQNKDVSTSLYDCRPFEGPGAAEVCHFSAGGVFNVIIDTPADYSAVTFKAYYDIHKDADASLPNQLPKARANGGYTAYLGHDLTLSSQGSVDPDGDIEQFLWSFGDGTVSAAENPVHRFEQLGNYSVTLTVTDNDGAVNSTTTEVKVVPVADFDQDGDVDKDDLRGFISALRSGEVLSLSFDLNGDGTVNNRDVRSFKVLCSYDNCSNLAPPVLNPVAEITLPADTEVNQVLIFDSAGSSVNANDRYAYIARYSWKFGDGTVSNEASPQHSYDSVGSYDVELTIEDNRGLTASIQKTIFVGYGALQDTCLTTGISENRSLEPSEINCLGEKSRYNFSIPEIKNHSKLAITLAHAEGDFTLYYRNDGWPSIEQNLYDSSVAGTNQVCLELDLSTDLSYWSYIQITGDAKGASIVVDFDTQGCRPVH